MVAGDNSVRYDAPALSTIGDWLGTFRGRIPAFDFMRFAAASVVIYAHSFGVAEDRPREEYFELLTNHVVNFGTLAVQFFFLISGFVVANSAARSAFVRT
jgi:peptidoglycan/LPS O-acetylase OafA/YrhL